MGNFDFRAFVAQQKEELRFEKEDRIIKESHKKTLLSERSKRSTRGTEMELMIESIMLDWASDKDIIEEGLWSKMKYYGGKALGTWEKGGGIWGRGERSEKAKEQYEKMLEKTAGGIIKKFMAQLGKDYPEFPNMESDEEFGKAIADIYTFYDSIKHAALTPKDIKGKPESVVQKAIDGGKIDVMMANQIIGDLRLTLHKTLDYDLADVYKHFDESKQPEDDEEVLDEIFGFGKRGWEKEAERQEKERAGVMDQDKQADAEPAHDWWDSLPEPQKSELFDAGEAEMINAWRKAGKPGPGQQPEEDVLSREKGDSASWKSLESNMLPLLLALGGATGVLGSVLIKAGWFADLFDQVVQNPTKPVFKTFGQTIFNALSPEPGEGVTQMIGRIAEGNPGAFSPDASPQELFSALKDLGIDPANPTELAELSGDPAAFLDAWKDAVGGGASTLGEMFPMEAAGDITGAATAAAAAAAKGVGPTIGDFKDAVSQMSPEQLQKLGSRAQEIGNVLIGQDIYSAGTPTPEQIMAVANSGDQAINMVSGTSKSFLALNVAAQEMAAGIPAEDVVSMAAESGGGPGALGLKLGKTAISAITKTVIKQVAKGGVKTGVKAGILGSAATASTILGALGVALGVSAAGVKALRLKGQHSSRLEKLQRLRDALDDLKDSPITPPKPPVTKCPPGETWDGEKCVPGADPDPGPGPGPGTPTAPDNLPYEFPLGASAQKHIEEIVINMLQEKGVEVDESDLEDLMGKIEDWLLRAAERGADYYDLENGREFMGMKEASEVSAGTGKLAKEPKKDDFARKFRTPRRKYKSKTGNIIAVGKSHSRSGRGVSLNTMLRRYLLGKQGTPEMFSSFSQKELRSLIKKIIIYVKKDLKAQGAEVQQQQQQESKRKQFGKILKTINEKLIKSNKKPINERQLAKYLKSRKKKLLK